MEIFVGCCGLPEGLLRYSKKFKLVEINSTFYRLPQVETAKKWRESVPNDFVFTVKAHQAISHPVSSPTWRRSGIKDFNKLDNKVGFLRPTKEVFDFWNKTLEICRVLNSPVCLIQLPASFKETEENMRNAEEFFSRIKRDGLSIALELRGWSKEGFKNICKKLELISCVDPFASEPVWFSNKTAYFRLHGCPPGKRMYSYKYTKKDLLELKRKVESLSGLDKIFILFNNLWMKENSTQFIKLLEK